jgi:hypothetical protein
VGGYLTPEVELRANYHHRGDAASKDRSSETMSVVGGPSNGPPL